MLNIIVITGQGQLKYGRKKFTCAIGKNGTTPFADGREGDGKTPLGNYALRYGLYRQDRIKLPKCNLQFHTIQKHDGWCDATGDPAYNRPVHFPYPASAENLYRDSHVYDIIIVLGHNDNPPVPDMGSAIFLHIARENYAPTQGCVAINCDDMLALLPLLMPKAYIEIKL